MSVQSSLTVIMICQIVFAMAALLAVFGLLYAIFSIKKMVNKKADEAFAKVQPIVDQAKSIAEKANATSGTVCDKIDSIMTKTETAVSEVSDCVVSVTNKVENAVSPKVTSTVGIIGAAMKAYQLYKEFSNIKQCSAKTDDEVKEIEKKG